MKLNNLIYGVLTIFAFSSCADQMEYSEYNPYDAGYVKRTFYDVGGLVSNIYQSLDSDFGNYSGAILGSATDDHNIPIQVMLLRLFTMGHGVR